MDYIYVDTASSGGDGTTRGHSGGTAAESSLDAALTSLSLSDDTTIRCAGSTADTTVTNTAKVTYNGYSLWIVADRGEDDSSGGGDDGTGYDDDGFYDGPLAWSTSHYRLDQSSGATTLGLFSDNVIIDGLQIGNDRAFSSSIGIDCTRHDNGIRNCTIKIEEGVGINLNNSSFQNRIDFIENCRFITDGGTPDTAIKCGRASNAANHTTRIYNNTIDGYDTGIDIVDDNTGDTWEIHNNVEINCTTGYSINTSNATVNATYNAGETTAPTGHDSNWIQLSGTLTDDLEDPNNSTWSSKDYTPVASGNLDDAGLGNSTDSNVPTTDIFGNSRDSSSPDIGAIELQSGAQTLEPSLFTNTQTFYAATVEVGQVLSPSLFTNTQTFYTPTVAAEQDLEPSLFTNTQTFYAATVTQGAGSQDLEPGLLTNTQTFYAPTVEVGQVLEPGLVTNTQTFFSPTVAAEQDLEPGLLTNVQTFFSPAVLLGKLLTPPLVTNTQTFFSPTVSVGTGQVLTASLFTNSQGWFYHNVTGGAKANILDVLQEVFKLATRAQGRKKSAFPALSSIPTDATFDFVSNGVNYKIPIMDFLTSLSVTGSIEQDGAATGVPVLDKQGSVNNIRNLEPGAGISASVSAENGIAISHNFQAGSGGEPILTDITADSPQIGNIIAGSGITVTAVAGGVEISIT